MLRRRKSITNVPGSGVPLELPVRRFNTKQLTDDLGGGVHSVATMINRCGGLILSDDSVKAIAETRPDGWKQLRLF